ncbi:MAG: cysteine hydrolase family protein [Anaerolineales bacterium]
MKTALLVIDIQNDYFPGGKMELEGALAAGQKAGQLLQCFREHGGRHIHIQHESLRPGATFFIPGTEGIRIHDTVPHYVGEPIVYKHFPNAFRETNLLEILRGWQTERLVICGMMTHMCVDATVRAAADLGFTVWLAADACATRALRYEQISVPAEQVQAAFLAALGSYARILPSEQILASLAEESDSLR